MLSYFWAPLCAVGSHDDERPNAQICVSVFGASIVPDRPRLMTVLSKTNYTHDLVLAAGTLAITVLSASQLALLEPLGLRSGRDGDKLAGLEAQLTPSLDPYFTGGTGYLACEVIERYDLGDSTALLCAVRERARLSDDPPMTWAQARERIDGGFLDRWAQKSQREQEAARAVMRWA